MQAIEMHIQTQERKHFSGGSRIDQKKIFILYSYLCNIVNEYFILEELVKNYNYKFNSFKLVLFYSLKKMGEVG